MKKSKSKYFFNRSFTKKKITKFILWHFNQYGEEKTLQFIEKLKKSGFQYSTQAGVSISIEDLNIPLTKPKFIQTSEQKIKQTEYNYQIGYLTEIERLQQFIGEWNRASETLKKSVISFFQAIDIFNPVYMMAFSGARGNISQVRQLVGMRGLMSDPQGQILDFPIRSNFREGLTLTEYLISCYGARKGIVDTALRTATSGYLTRRLVDVAQHVIIGQKDCHTERTVKLESLIDNGIVVLPLKTRLIGRVLGEDLEWKDSITGNKHQLAKKNYEISSSLAIKISQFKTQVRVRSPLTCLSENAVCQFCYGWNLSRGILISLGDSVGILAAQSIGEPGTQLTMRTFHTGGVFTGKLFDQVYAPFDGRINYLGISNGRLVRTLQGNIAFLTKTKERLQIYQLNNDEIFKINKKLFWSSQIKLNMVNKESILIKNLQHIENRLLNRSFIYKSRLIFDFPIHTLLFIRQGQSVSKKQLIAEFSSKEFKKGQGLESEYEIKSPVSGQIFFENLVLIEKNKTGYITQKSAYSFGSIWIVEGLIFQGLLNTQPLICYGDIINKYSLFQTANILIPNLYFIYFTYSKQPKTFGCDKSSKTLKYINSRFKVKRIIISFPIQKIYYKQFQYFSFFHSQKFPINCGCLNNKNLNSIPVIFNFGLKKKNNINGKKINNKTSFQLQSCISKKKQIEYYCQFCIRDSLLHNLKTQKPIFSRKGFDRLNFSYSQYKFWILFLEYYFLKQAHDSNPTNFEKFLIYWKPYQTSFFNQTKTFTELSEFFSTKINDQNSFSSDTKNDIYSLTDLIAKKFLNFNPICKNFLPFIQVFEPLSSNFTFLTIKLNRQGELIFIPMRPLISLKTQNLGFFHKSRLNFKSLFKNTLLASVQKSYNIVFKNWHNFNLRNSTGKPIVFHFNHFSLNFLKGQYSSSFLKSLFSLTVFYLRQPYLQLEAQQPKSMVGSKSNFRVFNIPNFKLILQNKPAIRSLKSKQFSFLLLKTEYLKNSYQNKQIYTEWIYLSDSTKFFKYLGTYVNYGFVFSDQICFDNQNIFVDFFENHFLCYKNLIKCNFQLNNRYRSIIGKKLKFPISNLINWKIIFFCKGIFKTSLEQIIPNSLFKKTLLSTNFLNNLFYNQILEFSNSFKTRPLLPSSLRSGAIKLSSKILQKKIFKLSSIFKIKWKTNFNLKKQLSMVFFQWTLFSPIYNVKSNSNSFYFRNWFSRSKLEFQFIKQKNTQLKILNRIISNTSIDLKIFYQNSNTFSSKNQIKFYFFKKINISEVIEQKEKNNYIFLDQNSLITFSNFSNIELILKIGNFLRSKPSFDVQVYYPHLGQIVYLDESKIILRRAFSVLVPERGIVSVSHGDFVNQSTRIFSFLYQRVKTGDIVQGIPKIEEFLEARSIREGSPVYSNLHWQLKQRFQSYNIDFSAYEAARKSFEDIQQVIIDEVQKVYCSQGVNISDKHLEIIVRQMISKVQIIEGSKIGLLGGELINLNWIELIHTRLKAWSFKYEPVLLGITKSCLETESFISAASFQETTRILTKASIQNRIDFIRGLKPNVILGNLIPAGTGFFPFVF